MFDNAASLEYVSIGHCGGGGVTQYPPGLQPIGTVSVHVRLQKGKHDYDATDGYEDRHGGEYKRREQSAESQPRGLHCIHPQMTRIWHAGRGREHVCEPLLPVPE